jgi:integrase/recombinase XerD
VAAWVLVEKWPVFGRYERAAEWLRMWSDLGRAPRTIDAYARGLAEFLQVCEDTASTPSPRPGPMSRSSFAS